MELDSVNNGQSRDALWRHFEIYRSSLAAAAGSHSQSFRDCGFVAGEKAYGQESIVRGYH